MHCLFDLFVFVWSFLARLTISHIFYLIIMALRNHTTSIRYFIFLQLLLSFSCFLWFLCILIRINNYKAKLSLFDRSPFCRLCVMFLAIHLNLCYLKCNFCWLFLLTSFTPLFPYCLLSNSSFFRVLTFGSKSASNRMISF